LKTHCDVITEDYVTELLSQATKNHKNPQLLNYESKMQKYRIMECYGTK
jgi:hypothetical protein